MYRYWRVTEKSCSECRVLKLGILEILRSDTVHHHHQLASVKRLDAALLTLEALHLVLQLRDVHLGLLDVGIPG